MKDFLFQHDVIIFGEYFRFSIADFEDEEKGLCFAASVAHVAPDESDFEIRDCLITTDLRRAISYLKDIAVSQLGSGDLAILFFEINSL